LDERDLRQPVRDSSVLPFECYLKLGMDFSGDKK